MNWRPAKSLEVLKGQLDESYPGWLFLGYLGDAAHAAVPSDHNPNSAGVVCALDIGPGGGLAIHELADRLVAKPHPDCKYIISNRRIAGTFSDWNWGAYDGVDPHDTHIHVSVGVGPDGQSEPPYDDTNLWNVKGEQAMDDDDVIQIHLAAGYSEADATNAKTLSAWRGKKPAELGKAIYSNNELYRYKASHYDADVAAAQSGAGIVLKPGNYTVK